MAVSFDQLRFVLQPGSDVRVFDTSGRTLKGMGARNGFIAGAALGLLASVAVGGEGGSAAALIPISIGVYGGIGAGIGVASMRSSGASGPSTMPAANGRPSRWRRS